MKCSLVENRAKCSPDFVSTGGEKYILHQHQETNETELVEGTHHPTESWPTTPWTFERVCYLATAVLPLIYSQKIYKVHYIINQIYKITLKKVPALTLRHSLST